MFEKNREFLKAYPWTNKTIESPRKQGVKQPNIFKESNEKRIVLPEFETLKIKEKSFSEIINKRRSKRDFIHEAMTLDTLSYLLHISYGITQKGQKHIFRSAPSGGNRHTIETYIVVFNIENLKQGIYLYLPLEHALVFKKSIENIKDKTIKALKNQSWIQNANFIFAWSTIPFRGEWLYVDKSHKLILLDAGHICQNVYLACEAIGLGTCAVAAYDQNATDSLIGLDGKDEFIIYLAPVGKI